MSEEWRDVIGYEGLYQVSSFGRIRSIDRTTLRVNGTKARFKGVNRKLSETKEGYNTLSLQKNSKPRTNLAHRLVAQAFIPNLSNKATVNHIDGNKKNNHVSNLEWATQKENVIHSFNAGLVGCRKGENAHNIKLSKQDVLMIRDMRSHSRKFSKKTQPFPLSWIANCFRVSAGTIFDIEKKKSWKHI